MDLVAPDHHAAFRDVAYYGPVKRRQGQPTAIQHQLSHKRLLIVCAYLVWSQAQLTRHGDRLHGGPLGQKQFPRLDLVFVSCDNYRCKCAPYDAKARCDTWFRVVGFPIRGQQGGTMSIGKALVVDDSKVVQFKLKKMLEARGVAVSTAGSGQEALDFLTGNAPDVIFMDCMMPGMDGYEATSVIKAAPQTAAIPVVMCTGHDTPEEQARARDHGANDYMVKPFDDAVLDAVIARLGQPASPAQACAAAPVPFPASAERVAAPVAAPVASAPTVPSAQSVAISAPAAAAAPGMAAEVVRTAEHLTREVTERQIRETMASMSAAFEQTARDSAQAAAKRVVADALAALRAELAQAHESARLAAVAAATQAAREAAEAAMGDMQAIRETVRAAVEDARDARHAVQSAADEARGAREATEGAANDARAAREAIQAAADDVQAMRRSDTALLENRLQDTLTGVHATAEQVARSSMASASAALEQTLRDLLESARADIQESAHQAAQAAAQPMAEEAARAAAGAAANAVAEVKAHTEALANTAAETTARTVAEQLLQTMLETARQDQAALRADMERAASAAAEQAALDTVRRSAEAAETARQSVLASAEAAIEARLQKALTSIQDAAERAVRPVPDVAELDFELEPSTLQMPELSATASLVPERPPESTDSESRLTAPPPVPERQQPAWSSRPVVLPWLAALTVAVLYLVVRSFS